MLPLAASPQWAHLKRVDVVVVGVAIQMMVQIK
jgi:hypothetical protein